MRSFHDTKTQYYRAEIDSLRAISIFLVVAFHFWPKIFKGGFIGVDVFFLISGYLITSIIARELSNNCFSFKNFYFKRMVRILPALCLLLFIILVAGSVLLLSYELNTLGRSVFSSAFFTTNFELFFDFGYFDLSNELKPLMHLWSLAVEEQFYLFWPLILFVSFSKNKFVSTIKWVSLISFILCVFLSKENDPLAYYSLLTRIWQLGFGGWAFLAQENNLLKKIRPRAQNTINFFAIVAIVISSFFISEYDNYPGFWALIPSLATMTFLLTIPTGIYKSILTNSPIVYIGKISYPLYLWHWPLLSFTKILGIWNFDLTINFILVAFSLLLAMLTYHFVEKPIQNLKNKSQTALVLGFFTVGLGTAGWLIYHNGGLAWRFPEFENSKLETQTFKSNENSADFKNCLKDFGYFEMCYIFNRENSVNTLLIGDSHASHLVPGLKLYAGEADWNFVFLGNSGVVPFINTQTFNRTNPDLNLAFDVLNSKLSNVDTVILAGFWSSYINENGVELPSGKYKNKIMNLKKENTLTQKQIFSTGLKDTIEFLASKNIRVILVYDIPYLNFSPNQCKIRPWIDRSDHCRISEEFFKNDYEFLKNEFQELKKRHPRIYAVDLLRMICSEPQKNQECRVSEKGTLFYTDSHHLSVSGSQSLVYDAFKKALVNSN